MRLLFAFLFFICGSVWAQELNNPNKLKLCQKNNNVTYDNCWGTFESEGDKYVGEFRDHKYHGQGTYTFSDGDKYVGEFKNGKYHGQGTITYASGDKYVGEYKDDKRDGQGTYTFANGNKYVGEFKDGKYHGQGAYLFSDGRKEIGEYEGRNLNGKGVRIRADGSVYESGFYKDDKLVDSFNVDPLSFTRIPRQYLVAEKKSTNTQSPAPVVTNQIDEDALQTDNSSLPTDNRRRFALVIGNANYSSLPKLQNSVNDARLITQSLRSAGFQVSTYENLDMGGMENAIRAFGERLNKTDVGLFYYAGHGVQVKGKNYLIPVKENIKKSFEVPSRAIDVDVVLATLENIKNDLNIVVLDACRSSFPDERGINRGLASVEAAKGTFIAFATAPGKGAQDGEIGRNSPYTKHLARLIGKKGLHLEQVFKEVRKAVVAETRGDQVPWENSSLMGDFYFKK